MTLAPELVAAWRRNYGLDAGRSPREAAALWPKFVPNGIVIALGMTLNAFEALLVERDTIALELTMTRALLTSARADLTELRP